MLYLFTDLIWEYSYLVFICDVLVGIFLFGVGMYIWSRLRDWMLRRW